MKEIINIINKRLKSNNWGDNILVFLLILVVLSFIYAPVIKGYYLFSDDYSAFIKDTLRPDWSNFEKSLIMGRPLHYYLKLIAPNLINNVESANLFRFLSIMGIALFSYRIFLFLKTNNSGIHAVLISLLISILTPYQENISYATTWMLGYLYFASFISGTIALRMFVEESNQKVKYFHLSKYISIPSILLLIIINFIYQAATLIYWIPIVLYYFFIYSNKSKFPLKMIIKYIINGIVALVLYSTMYILIIKIGKFQFANYSGGLIKMSIDSVYLKLNYLLDSVYFSVNLFYLSLNPIRAIIVSSFVIIGILLPLPLIINKQYEKYYLIKQVIFVFVLIPLTYLPFLLTDNNIYTPRSFLALSPFILILFLKGIINIINIYNKKRSKRIFTYILLIILIFGGHICNNNVYKYMVLPQTIEFRYLLSELREAHITENTRIHLIQPVGNDAPINDNNIFGWSFGTMSSNRYYVPKPMVVRALDEIGFDKDYTLYLTTSKFNKEIIFDSNTVVIDMRKVYNFREGNGDEVWKMNFKFPR